MRYLTRAEIIKEIEYIWECFSDALDDTDPKLAWALSDLVERASYVDEFPRSSAALEKVLVYIVENPGCKYRELEEETGLSKSFVRKATVDLMGDNIKREADETLPKMFGNHPIRLWYTGFAVYDSLQTDWIFDQREFKRRRQQNAEMYETGALDGAEANNRFKKPKALDISD